MSFSTSRIAYPAALMKRRLSVGAAASAIRKKAIQRFGAPKSINAIPDDSTFSASTAGAFVRSIGCTRRVFLLDPHLRPAELEGLAYRIRALSRNEALNSVLIATSGEHDTPEALPRMLLDRQEFEMVVKGEFQSDPSPPAPGQTWHVAAGYDPLKLFKRGEHTNADAVHYVLDSLGDLARAVRGDHKSKIPVITVPHGAVTDGGFAFLLGSHVMVTDESCFRILNPSRGLSLDPVGLSYLLPRLGREFAQPAAEYPGCGLILALTGYEASAMDMMETGLATNYMETLDGLGPLEAALAELPPWNQQAPIKKPTRYYGDDEPSTDHNAAFRNVAVADVVDCLTTHRADGADVCANGYEDPHYYFSDPSLDPNPVPDFEDRSSNLVNYAATFHHIFNGETSVAGILNAFREIAAKVTNDPEEQEGIDVAKDFVRRLESQSPLALSCVYGLLWTGSSKDETLETCMERERKVQAKLLAMPDFEKWARYHSKPRIDGVEPAPFTAWQHNSLEEVSRDQVAEILELSSKSSSIS